MTTTSAKTKNDKRAKAMREAMRKQRERSESGEEDKKELQGGMVVAAMRAVLGQRALGLLTRCEGRGERNRRARGVEGLRRLQAEPATKATGSRPRAKRPRRVRDAHEQG